MVHHKTDPMNHLRQPHSTLRRRCQMHTQPGKRRTQHYFYMSIQILLLKCCVKCTYISKQLSYCNLEDGGAETAHWYSAGLRVLGPTQPPITGSFSGGKAVGT